MYEESCERDGNDQRYGACADRRLVRMSELHELALYVLREEFRSASPKWDEVVPVRVQSPRRRVALIYYMELLTTVG